MEGRSLEAVHEESDLGIIITKYFKCIKQCLNAAKAANKILEMIKRTFFLLINLGEDIDLLEKVQRRATRLIYSLHDLPYYVRLKILKLTTLETRRVRGDLIQVFKIIKGFEDVDSNTFFKIASSTNLRGHSLGLYKHKLRLDTRK